MDWITSRVRTALWLSRRGRLLPSSFQGFPAQGPAHQPIAKCLLGPTWSVSTSILLERLGMEDLAKRHPGDAYSMVEQATNTQNPRCPRLLALAELADRTGQTAATDEGIVRSRDAAVYAIFCLETLPVDPARTAIGSAAREVHNRAVAQCLDLAHAGPGQWSARLAAVGIITAPTGAEWTALGFDCLQPANDRVLKRPASVGCRPGLGVPLIARRRLADRELPVWKHYGPRERGFRRDRDHPPARTDRWVAESAGRACAARSAT